MIVFTRFLRDRRRSLGWWSAAMLGVVFISVSFYPSLRDQPSLDEIFENLPKGIQSLIGASGLSIRSPAGYLQSRFFSTLLPMTLLVFAIALGARAIAGSEDDGTLELHLANPVSRLRLALERCGSMALLVVGLGAATTAALIALAAPFELLDGASAGRLAAACAAATIMALLHAFIAFFVGAAFGGRGRAIAVTSAVAVGGYLIFGLVSGGVIRATRFVSPWYWYLNHNIVAQWPGLEALLLPLGLSALLAAVGVWRFQARDLR